MDNSRRAERLMTGSARRIVGSPTSAADFGEPRRVEACRKMLDLLDRSIGKAAAITR